MPDTIQTSSTPTILGTWCVTSDAWTKTADPMMVPTTSAVAWGSLSVRCSSPDTAGE